MILGLPVVGERCGNKHLFIEAEFSYNRNESMGEQTLQMEYLDFQIFLRKESLNHLDL